MADQAQGLFLVYTLAQVQAIVAGQFANIVGGKTQVSGSVAGKAFTMSFSMPQDQILAEARYAIQILTGGQSGGGPIIRRVSSSFSRGGPSDTLSPRC